MLAILAAILLRSKKHILLRIDLLVRILPTPMGLPSLALQIEDLLGMGRHGMGLLCKSTDTLPFGLQVRFAMASMSK